MAKRTSLFLVLMVLLVPILSACGGDTPTATVVAEPSATTAGTSGDATATVATGTTGDATATTGTSEATATTGGTGTEATATTGGTGTEATATTGTGGSGGTTGTPATTGVLIVSPNGNQSTTFVRNFNPFGAAPLFPTLGGIYEPLMIYNTIKGEIVPWLADKYEWSADNKTLTFTLHNGAKWSDGQPFTANDVVYTFNLLKNTPGLQGSGTTAVGEGGYVSGVTASGDSTVVFNFSTVNTPGLYDIINQDIVPEHVWKSITDPAKDTNANPVGTGPFTQVTRFEAQSYQIDKNPNYWQPGKPYINGLRVPALAGNDQAATAFASGNLDWGGFVVANIEQSVMSKDPANLHFWFPTVGGTALFMMNTTKKPFDDPAFRKAVSMGLNRTQMIALGLKGYSHPSDVTGLSEGFATWKPSDPNSLGNWTTYDVAKANAALDAAGYKKGADGIRTTPDGKKITFEFTMVNGFSDWVAVAPTLVQNLKAIGLDPQQKNYDFPVWLSNWQTGKSDTSLYFGFNAPIPYTVYRNIMSKATVKPVGENSGFFNLWRYSSPKADDLLTQWAATSDIAKQKQLALDLEKTFADEAPVLPMWPQPSFFEYSTKNFTGWPTKEDPYALGAAAISNATREQLIVLTTVKPK